MNTHTLRLNKIQKRFWLDDIISHSNRNNLTFIFKILGKLDIKALHNALHIITIENPLFHAYIRQDEGKNPYWDIRKDFILPINAEPLIFKSEQEINIFADKNGQKPFKLQEEYPCKYFLLKGPSDYFYLMIKMHHIIIDAPRFLVFTNRLSKLYNDQSHGLYNETPTESIEIFNDLERSLYTNERKKSDMAYWTKYIGNANFTIPISTSETGQKEPTLYAFKLGKELQKECLSFCAMQQTSLFRLFASAWAITVIRTFNLDDLFFTYAVDICPTKLKKTIGVFINNLLLHISTHKDKRFIDVIRHLSSDRRDARNHQDFNLSELTRFFRKLGTSGNIDNVGFNYPISIWNNPGLLSFEGCETFLYRRVTMEPINDLMLEINDDDEALSFILANKKIPAPIIRNLSDSFKNVLRAVLENPSIEIRKIPLANTSYQDSIIQSNIQSVQLPQCDKTVIDIFKQTVNEHENDIAIVTKNKRLSFKTLDILSDQVAASITQTYAHLGYPASGKRRIGLYSVRDEYMLISIWGILKAGCSYVPLDLSFPEERINFILNDSSAFLVIVNHPEKRLFSTVQSLYVQEIIQTTNGQANPIIHAKDEAYVIYTSGTTGTPKGVPILHENLMNVVNARHTYIPPKENKMELFFANIAFDASILEIFPPLLTGVPVYITNEEERHNLDLLVGVLTTEKITSAFIPPALLSIIPYTDLPDLKYLVVAGEGTSLEVIKRWQQTTTVINAYGPTESTVCSTVCIMGDNTPANDIGTPLPGVSCYILDEYQQILPCGIEGELYIGGLQLTEGYINRPELNKEKFIENPFASSKEKETGINTRLYKSGDIVKRLPNGHILFIGRKDTQIKIRGYRIETAEIEARLCLYPGINQALVCVYVHNERKILVAYVQVDSSIIIQSQHIHDFLKERLPNYMLPSSIMVLHSFPLTANGKIDREELPKPILYNKAEKQRSKPSNPIEKEVAEIWNQMLHIDEIGMNDNFISLGGDSLQIIQMAMSLEKRYHIRIQASDIFEHIVLRDLVFFIEEKIAKERFKGNLPKATPNAPILLAPSQKSLWLQCQYSKEIQVAYNIPIVLSVEGEFDQECFEQTFNRILECHESLRTFFPIDATGVPHIEIHPHRYHPIQKETLSDEDPLSVLHECIKSPINLSTGPLFFCKILELSSDSHILVFVFHHLIIDGISCGLFCNQLLDIYSKLLNNEKPIKQKMAYSYIDYAFIQNQSVTNSDLTDKLNFWNRYLMDCVDLDLQVGQSHASIFDYKGDSYGIELPSELSKRISLFCEELAITPFIFFLSLYQLLLIRYTRQFNFAIGIPTSGREFKEFEEVIGYFVHPLPIRPRLTDIKDQTLFTDYVIKLQSDLREITRHALSLDKILKACDDRQVFRADMPLVQVMFSFGDYSVIRQLKNCSIQSIPISRNTSAFPLSLEIIPGKQVFSCNFQYMTCLFDKRTIEGMATCFYNLIEQALNYKDTPMMRLSLLSEQSKSIYIEQNKIEIEQTKRSDQVITLFKQVAHSYKDKDAIISNGHTLSYQQLDKLSDTIAKSLCFYYKNHGFQTSIGQRIGLYSDRDIYTIVAILGILKAGCSYVPLDKTHPVERINFILNDCKASLVLQNTQDIPTFDIPATLSLQELLKQEVEIQLPPFDETTEVYLIYTSGTTGVPKGVPILHRNLLNLIYGKKNILAESESTIETCYSNIAFDGSVWEIFPPLLNGSTLYMITEEERHSPDLLLKVLAKHGISQAFIPPAMLAVLPYTHLPQLKFLTIAGESTSPEVIKLWQQTATVINSYGPTENTVCATACILEKDSPFNDIGTPLSGVSCYVLDENDQLLPEGIVGELYIGGLQLTEGYINHQEQNEEKFIDNPFVTPEEIKSGINMRLYKSGDLVKRMPNGHLLFIGRKDSQIKIRGFRIETEEIEHWLTQYPNVQQALISVQNIGKEKQLVAYIQTTQKEHVKALKLKEYLFDHLPSYMIPTYWSVMDKFPITSNGKIDLKHLPAPSFAEDKEHIAPSTIAEILLLNIVKNILQLEQISVEADLFNIGITSIQVMQLVLDANTIGISISVSMIYRSRSIRNILKDKHSTYCYWGNEYQKEKPILIVVCGYPYFNPGYNEFASVLGETYSLLVLESYNEFFLNKEKCTLDILLADYIKILRPILKGKTVFGITGLCLGGEIGLQLAYKLSDMKIATPKVFVLDGFAFREKTDQALFIEEPGVCMDVNKERNRISNQLTQSLFFNAYQGETHICLAKQFTKKLRFENLPEETDENILKLAYAQFSQNEVLWKKKLPHCKIHFLNANHWEILKAKPSLEIKQLMEQVSHQK